MSFDQYKRARTSLPNKLKQVLVLAWTRAARIADILELRVGGLWVIKDNVIGLECGPAKNHNRVPHIVIRLPLEDHRLLLPLLATSAPSTPPLARPPLFTDITTAHMTAALKRIHPRLSAHSIRHGAIDFLTHKGFSLDMISQLSLHRSRGGIMAYVGMPPPMTCSSLCNMSFALATGPPASPPDPPP